MRDAGRAERGASLVGLLVVLVALGVTAAIVVKAIPSTSSVNPTLPTTTSAPTGATTTTSRSIVSASLVAECVGDVQAVQSASQSYDALNGSLPPAGTSWATTKSTAGIQYLQSWPDASAHFTLSWNGSAVVVTPRHGPSVTGSAGTSSPATGCYTV